MPVLPPSPADAHGHELKQSQAFQDGICYFITMDHQAGVNFENFTEVKYRDISVTWTNV